MSGHHGHRGGRHRARRGAVLSAVLTLLDERPMHGYELINELDARSDGQWRPSAGTMYPALGRMEAHGLIAAEQLDGKKQFSLTDSGRAKLAELREQRSDEAPAPWHAHGTAERGQLRRAIAELVGPAKQIGRFGSQEQVDAATDALRTATQRLYEILATKRNDSSDDTSTVDPSSTDAAASDTGISATESDTNGTGTTGTTEADTTGTGTTGAGTTDAGTTSSDPTEI